MLRTLTIPTPGRALIDITPDVAAVVHAAQQLGQLDPEKNGLCTVFVRHTSASVIIQENADPAVRIDLEAWLSRLVRDGDLLFTHDEEGPDDMPSHIRSALTATSVAIPIAGARLALGTWQGIYLWEHRTAGRDRQVVVHVSA
ncbi:MAG: secondary thiamine-phosphate synthase enzyme YjbQ [Phycisphaerales bacterium]